jgi:hypothetical protein
VLHPELSDEVLDGCERICREAMEFGHARVPVWWHRTTSEAEAFTRWSEEFMARFPWATDANRRRVFSQGMYYAHKDGEL